MTSYVHIISGAETNLKVGDTGPKQKWGHRSGAKRRYFFVVPLHFLALKAQLVVLVGALKSRDLTSRVLTRRHQIKQHD